MPQYRKIIHIDMDAFFASVEQRDFPEYRGKPVAVGWPERRGVVSAASYEARKFGIHSAMPSLTANKKCRHLIWAKPRFDAYKEASDTIMSIFREYTELVEPMSLDEAYLDVTTNKMKMPSATIIAEEIRAKIKEQTQLTASAGVSINKFLAKVASDMDKPDGLFIIRPEDTISFIETLPVKKIPYVGKVTAAKMNKLGIYTGGDLRRLTKVYLLQNFGKPGMYYYQIVRNEYDSPVVPEHTRKSIGAERTFMDDITDEKEMLEAIKKVIVILKKRMKKKDVRGKTVTLKIKYFDFEQRTRSKTLGFYINPEFDLYPVIKELFYSPLVPNKPVRLLGVSISTLNNIEDEESDRQMSIEWE